MTKESLFFDPTMPWISLKNGAVASRPLAELEQRLIVQPEPATPLPTVRPREIQPGEQTMRTCPVCGAALHDRKCKLFCPDPSCGFFLSCADFY
jgi:hypothetical protein